MAVGSNAFTTYTDAPGRRRKARWVQATLVLGCVVLVTLLMGLAVVRDRPPGLELVAYALVGLLVGASLAWMYRRARMGNRLELDGVGIRVEIGTHEVRVPWSAVAEIARERCGPYQGPTLLLDREVPMMRSDDERFLQLVTLSPEAERPPVDCVSLVPFLDGLLEDSPIADDLRRHVPEVVRAALQAQGEDRPGHQGGHGRRG